MQFDGDSLSDDDVADRLCARTRLLSECPIHSSNFFHEDLGTIEETVRLAARLLAAGDPLVARFRGRPADLERLIEEFSVRYQHRCHACAESHF